MRLQFRYSPAFTLIELLAVIGVIAVLLAILLPSLAGAREAGRLAVCSSNIRQLHIANETYANDAKDRYCPGAPDFLANLTRWHGARPSASAPFVPEGGTLTAYLADDGGGHGASTLVRACPTFAPARAVLANAGMTGGFERSAGGYGYNNAFVGVELKSAGRADHGRGGPLWTVANDRIGSMRARFAAPSITAAFADAALADGRSPVGVIEYSFIEPRFWPDSDPAVRPDPSIHFRHFSKGKTVGGVRGGPERANVCRLDGHVAAERLAFSTSSGVFLAAPSDSGIGWFGEADDNSEFEYR